MESPVDQVALRQIGKATRDVHGQRRSLPLRQTLAGQHQSPKRTDGGLGHDEQLAFLTPGDHPRHVWMVKGAGGTHHVAETTHEPDISGQ